MMLIVTISPSVQAFNVTYNPEYYLLTSITEKNPLTEDNVEGWMRTLATPFTAYATGLTVIELRRNNILLEKQNELISEQNELLRKIYLPENETYTRFNKS